MQKIIGVVSLAIGVWLLVRAHNLAESLGSQVQEAFTGAPTDRATYFYLAGGALALFGLVQIFWKRK